MKICHYNNHQAGVVVSDKVINFGDNLIKAGLARQGYTMVEIIDALANNPAAMQIARDAAQSSSGGLALSSVKLLAPIQNPGSLWAAAANYYAHRAEMVDRMGSANKEIKNKDDLMAEFFLKTTSSIIGPGDTIVLPKISKLVDGSAGARLRVRVHDVLGHQPARSVGQGYAQHAQYSQRVRYL
jgi:2-keto-4-pentenoate hydratase/2-oxohepta-3-ene-1,7-dioic acid hydratase in catechol pathway